jgi:hypothetical protein
LHRWWVLGSGNKRVHRRKDNKKGSESHSDPPDLRLIETVSQQSLVIVKIDIKLTGPSDRVMPSKSPPVRRTHFLSVFEVGIHQSSTKANPRLRKPHRDRNGGRNQRESGLSESQKMIRGLVEAAPQLQTEQRGVLKLTPSEERFSKRGSVKSEKKRGEQRNYEQVLHKPGR